MARKQRTLSQTDGLSHKFIRNNQDIQVATNIKLGGTLTARGIAWIDSNHEARLANAHTPHTFGVLAANVSYGATDPPKSFYVSGPALVYPQTAIEPSLPVKVSESGRVVNGIQIQTGLRVILAATNGLDSEITVSSGNDETLDIVSNSTADTSQTVYVYVKQATTGTAKLLAGKLNGTTAVVLNEVGGSGGAISVDEVLGVRMDATAAGSMVLANVTSSTTLVTITTGNTTAALTSTTNSTYSYGRKVRLTVSAAGADEFMIIGTDEAGSPLYEIITHAASMPIVLRTQNRFNTVTYVAHGNFAAARTFALAGLDSNVFEPSLRNEYANVTYTSGNQPGTGGADLIQILSDEATDDAIITVVGYDDDDSDTIRFDAITLNGTTPVSASVNFTHVYGAFVSQVSTGTQGAVTIEDSGTSDILVFDTATYYTAGLLVPYEGNEGVIAYLDSTNASTVTHEVNGANAYATLTCSNSAATDVLIVYGEDVDGSAQSERVVLVGGVIELANRYSRILIIAGVTLAATETIAVSFTEDDDYGSFTGFAISGSDTQSTSTAVEINFKSSASSPLGPDIDWTTTFQKAADIHTVGVGLDYDTVTLAEAAASAGDSLWLMDQSYSETVTISKALTLIGFNDDVVITSATAAGATVTVTGDSCEFRNVNFANTQNGAAADIAITLTNVGANFINCEFNGGTDALNIALQVTANGADLVNLIDCRIVNGIFDFDGNAASILKWDGGESLEAAGINTMDTGTFLVSNVKIDGLLTLGGTAAPASVSLIDSPVVGAFVITDCDDLIVDGGTITGAITHTAATLSKFLNLRITGAVTIPASTDLEFDSVRMASTLGFTAAALMEIRDSEIIGAVTAVNTGTSVVTIHNSSFAGQFHADGAAIDIFAYKSYFAEGFDDDAGTYGIIELNDCKIDATTESILCTLVGTSFTVNGGNITNLINLDGGTVTINRATLEEIDQDGGTLNTFNCLITGAHDSAGTYLDTGSTIVGVLADSGTTTLQGTYLVGTATGTLLGNYTQYNSGYKIIAEGGNTKQAKKFICGGRTNTDEQVLTLAGGAVLDNDNTTLHVAWGVGNLAGGNATRGYWDFDAVTELVTVAIPLPELGVDTGTAADFRIGFRVDPTNVDDIVSYAVYDQAGLHLVDETAQTMSGGSGEHTHWINIGALAWSKGDALIISVGNFEVAATGAVDVKFYWIEIDFTVGIENDT